MLYTMSICAPVIQLTFSEWIKRKKRAWISARLDVLTEQNRTEHVMLYNMICVMLCYITCYTMMWMLRALWLVVAHDLLEYRYMNDVTGDLFSLFLFNMARGFEIVCEIISDWGKWKLRKNFSRKYLQRRKMEKRRPKKLLATWQCLNYKKSSQQLPSCVFATRDSLFCKMFSPLFFFEQEKTVKNFSKKLYTSKTKKKLRWKVGFGT